MIEIKVLDALERLKSKVSELGSDSIAQEAVAAVSEALEETPQCCELHCIDFLYRVHMLIVFKNLDLFDERVLNAFHNTALELMMAYNGSLN